VSKAATSDQVALAVIVRGIEAPCQVSRVSEVLAWIVPLLGHAPGTGVVDLRCPCPTLPAEIERLVGDLRDRRSIVKRLVPGRRGRMARLDLTTHDGREEFCLLAPWSDDARIVAGRKHLLAVAGGTRSFWVELPKEKADDLGVWFRRRGLGRVIDMDAWAAEQPPPERRSRRRR